MSESTLAFSLRFISGKYQGGEFPLQPDREIVIGRSSELDVVLVEDMVSRKHARIQTTDGQIVIQDLGSTNGTFVNGEKVKKMALKEGDRILIGTSIIKLVTGDEGAALSPEAARQKLEQTGNRRAAAPTNKTMTGAIEEIPLPDLMQLLSTSRKSGVLTVRSDHGVGKLFKRKGALYHANIDESTTVPARKAIFRMLTWTQGTFELEAPDETPVAEELQESTEGLLMEGMRQLDEMTRIQPDLPAPGAQLALATPLEPLLRELTPPQLDTLQSIINLSQLQQILDKRARSDYETAQAILDLIQKNYIVVR